MTAVPLTEKQFAGQVADCAKALGWRRYHTFRSERSPAGFPDEVLARDRVVFIELKTSKGKPSPFQTEWLDALARAGAETYLARPSDLDDLARILRRWWRYEPGLLRHDTAAATDVWTPGCLWIPGVGRADTQTMLAA